MFVFTKYNLFYTLVFFHHVSMFVSFTRLLFCVAFSRHGYKFEYFAFRREAIQVKKSLRLFSILVDKFFFQSYFFVVGNFTITTIQTVLQLTSF